MADIMVATGPHAHTGTARLSGDSFAFVIAVLYASVHFACWSDDAALYVLSAVRKCASVALAWASGVRTKSCAGFTGMRTPKSFCSEIGPMYCTESVPLLYGGP